ncbi:MAG TPA: PQQ-binding-like beta-propeller repeat protein, partial [Solirubrobacteraceae bacterium]|nr:PQQ-binding-like beta-propeller repeat protein [Solirubrobacteraceae bacterium]
MVSLSIAVAPAFGEIVTQDSESMRSGWYPNEPLLSQATLGGGTFGQIFKTPVQGQVYAQPLVANGKVFVATNDDWIYGLDPQTGEVLWHRSVGPPENVADEPGGGWCPNPTPHIGILGTPVIDSASNVAYFVAKTYVPSVSGSKTAFYMHAVDLANGQEQPNFPVLISGSAENLPSVQFEADYSLQRPGLLLMNGVVYAGFGSICDIAPFHGWVVGVSTTGHQTALWTTSPLGGSIWQSGGALVSDGPGRIIFSTGNSSTFDGGGAPPKGPGSAPPSGLAESVVKVGVQPNGSLKAEDFFSPVNNVELDQNDTDLGSSAPMALPSQYFGTPNIPHLLVQDGKEGIVFLLNRDNLGGMGQGPGNSDQVVQWLGPNGGVWDAMASWPGDGGYVYIINVNEEFSGQGNLRAYKYSVNEGGNPAFALAASSPGLFAFGSGSPVVTSDGTTAGSGVVWTTLCAAGSCEGESELRAYAAVPGNHASPPSNELVQLWSAQIGEANKFSAPGVGENRIYVGTHDQNIIG